MLGRFLTEFPLFAEDLDLGPTVIHMSRKLVLGKRYSNDQSDLMHSLSIKSFENR